MKTNSKDNVDLLDEFEIIIAEATKAANGWSRKSEARLNERAKKLRSEVLRRLKECNNQR